jgi:predicted nucleic acid-binding protein
VPIIELDLLIAFVNASDKRHEVADKVFREIMNGKIKNAKVASSAYLEYELVHRSLGYPLKDTKREILSFRNFPSLGEESLTSKVIVKAMQLRETIGMTYFDSLHASTALLTDREIISTDSVYDKVDSLTRIEPKHLDGAI